MFKVCLEGSMPIWDLLDLTSRLLRAFRYSFVYESSGAHLGRIFGPCWERKRSITGPNRPPTDRTFLENPPREAPPVTILDPSLGRSHRVWERRQLQATLEPDRLLDKYEENIYVKVKAAAGDSFPPSAPRATRGARIPWEVYTQRF